MKNLFLFLLLTCIFIACHHKNIYRTCQEPTYSYIYDLQFITLAKDCHFVDLLIKEKWHSSCSTNNKYAFDRELVKTLSFAKNCFIGNDSNQIRSIFGNPSTREVDLNSLVSYSYEVFINDCVFTCYLLKVEFDSSGKTKYYDMGKIMYSH